MKNLAKRISRVKDSIERIIAVKRFEKALLNNDIHTIIEYVNSGGDVNVPVTLREEYEGCLLTTRCRPLDIARHRNEDIAHFLAEKGALTQIDFENLERERIRKCIEETKSVGGRRLKKLYTTLMWT